MEISAMILKRINGENINILTYNVFPYDEMKIKCFKC